MLAVFFVWFAGIVGSLSFALGAFALILAASLGMWFLFTALHNDSYSNTEKKPYPLSKSSGRWLTTLAVFMSLMWAVLPSEKTVYLMGGAYMGQAVIQSETANKVTTILNNKLDQYIDEGMKKAGKVAEKAVEQAVDKVIPSDAKEQQ